MKYGEKYNVLKELREMLPIYIIGAAALLAGSTVYWLISGAFDFRHITGIIAGSALSVGYFYSLGHFTGAALRRKNGKKAAFTANMYYGMRYAALFAAYSLLLAFNLANVVTSIIPLFFPRIFYFISAVKSMKTDNQ